MRCEHQVQRVPDVLSTGNDSPHMYGVRTIENEMKPWEIWRKCNFSDFLAKMGGILGLKKKFALLKTLFRFYF